MSFSTWFSQALDSTKQAAAKAAEATSKAASAAAEATAKAASAVAEESKKAAASISDGKFLEKTKEFGADVATATVRGATFVASKTVEGATFIAVESKKGATAMATGIEKTMADLKAVPTEIRCKGCRAELKVPPSVFEWTCINNHTVAGSEKVCGECGDTKPMGTAATKPSIICPDCNTSTVIPTSRAQMKLQNAPADAGTFFVETGKNISTSVENMTKAPEKFNCNHCHSLLHVPTGPWECQTCGATNPEADTSCCRCEQSKSDQQVLCGICRRSTTIPQTNFTNSLSTSLRSATKTSHKLLLRATKKAFVTCTRCEGHIILQPGDAQTEVECPTCTARVPVQIESAAPAEDVENADGEIVNLSFDELPDDSADTPAEKDIEGNL